VKARQTHLSLKSIAITASLGFFKLSRGVLGEAVKFTNDGGTVDILVSPYDQSWLRLQVRDAGIGIEAEDFGKLFTEFQQLDSGTDRRYQGTGLGLALTRKIVELRKGTIGLESEVGKGSTFTVVLPRSLEEVRA
jgi:protein-histidine pros-kinase